MNLQVLNKYVLGVIGLFALCLYLAMVAAGFVELMSGLPKARARRKRLKSTRKWQNSKRSPHSWM